MAPKTGEIKIAFKGFNWSSAFWAGIGQVVRMIGALLTMSYYLDPAFFGVWSPLMMPSNAAPPVSFFVLSFVVNFGLGAMFFALFSWVRPVIDTKNPSRATISFSSLVFGLSIVPYTASLLLLINLPLLLILEWAVESLAIFLVWTYVVARLIKT